MHGENHTRLVSRREALAAAIAAGLVAARTQGQATAEATGALADYVHAPDPATRVEQVAAGRLADGRFATLRLVSQAWRGVEWTHELSLFLPAKLEGDGRTMLLWIDGGMAGQIPDEAAAPTPTLGTLAVVARASGLPAAVVRQVPFQPMFDGLLEDDLIAHTFVEYVKTGDPTWPLLLPMVKAAVEAMTAATQAATDAWGHAIERFVVTGASKRGWTTWLTAAVDGRVAGAMPMVIDMLSMERHVALQRASFGGLSEKLGPYTAVGMERLLESPRGRELCGIVDPYAYRRTIKQPKIIALGTNDPYWPLESLSLYLDGLAGPRWVSYAPNAGHGLPAPHIGGLAAALGRHVAGGTPLPSLEWSLEPEPAGGGRRFVVRSDEPPEGMLLWTAASDTRDFRPARWRPEPVAASGDAWQASLPRPERGFAAWLVEARYPRAPLPLSLTTNVHVERAG